jgi:hypothetical protein
VKVLNPLEHSFEPVNIVSNPVKYLFSLMTIKINTKKARIEKET